MSKSGKKNIDAIIVRLSKLKLVTQEVKNISDIMHTAKKISNPAMSKSKLLCRFLGFILQVQFFLNLSSLHKRQRGA